MQGGVGGGPEQAGAEPGVARGEDADRLLEQEGREGQAQAAAERVAGAAIEVEGAPPAHGPAGPGEVHEEHAGRREQDAAPAEGRRPLGEEGEAEHGAEDDLELVQRHRLREGRHLEGRHQREVAGHLHDGARGGPREERRRRRRPAVAPGQGARERQRERQLEREARPGRERRRHPPDQPVRERVAGGLQRRRREGEEDPEHRRRQARRSARPGRAPVCAPSRTTAVPSTSTWAMPAGGWCGSA